MDEETKQAIDGLDRRLKEVEKAIEKKPETSSVDKDEHDTSGLKGGINLLINDKFFDSPKALNEVHKELARLNYHYSNGALSTALARDFIKKKRILTRIIEGGVYKYVLRK